MNTKLGSNSHIFATNHTHTHTHAHSNLSASKFICPETITETFGAYHLTEKSGWVVESIMVSDLPVYGRIATFVTV